MTTHLYRREGGTYYFRRAIPVALRSQFDGKREWVKSLATKDRREAKRLLPSLIKAFDDAMDGKPVEWLARPLNKPAEQKQSNPNIRRQDALRPALCPS